MPVSPKPLPMWSKTAFFLLAAALALSACSRDPRTTRLPLDLKDIPKIQPQLDKLPAEEVIMHFTVQNLADMVARRAAAKEPA